MTTELEQLKARLRQTELQSEELGRTIVTYQNKLTASEKRCAEIKRVLAYLSTRHEEGYLNYYGFTHIHTPMIEQALSPSSGTTYVPAEEVEGLRKELTTLKEKLGPVRDKLEKTEKAAIAARSLIANAPLETRRAVSTIANMAHIALSTLNEILK